MPGDLHPRGAIAVAQFSAYELFGFRKKRQQGLKTFLPLVLRPTAAPPSNAARPRNARRCIAVAAPALLRSPPTSGHAPEIADDGVEKTPHTEPAPYSARIDTRASLGLRALP